MEAGRIFCATVVTQAKALGAQKMVSVSVRNPSLSAWKSLLSLRVLRGSRCRAKSSSSQKAITFSDASVPRASFGGTRAGRSRVPTPTYGSGWTRLRKSTSSTPNRSGNKAAILTRSAVTTLRGHRHLGFLNGSLDETASRPVALSVNAQDGGACLILPVTEVDLGRNGHGDVRGRPTCRPCAGRRELNGSQGITS